MWDLPGQGLEPVFPAFAGGLLTTAKPGKPQTALLIDKVRHEKLKGTCLVIPDLGFLENSSFIHANVHSFKYLSAYSERKATLGSTP